MPIMSVPIANTPMWPDHPHSAIAMAHQIAPATMVQRSPWRIVISDAGMLLSNDPMPIRPTSRAVTDTEAPIARAVSGITGRIAPLPSPNSREGPKAVRAICRSEKAAGVIGALYGMRWWQWHDSDHGRPEPATARLLWR